VVGGIGKKAKVEESVDMPRIINDKKYELVMKILESDLSAKTKDEIVRFYTLPRNTPVKPHIELANVEEKELGAIDYKEEDEEGGVEK
jgi:hypothetical protein